MTQNPFETPRARTDAPGHQAMPGGTGTFDIGQCVSEAWRAVWSNFPLWLGVGIVGFLIAGLSYITIIGILIVGPVLAWGGVKFTLNMLEDKAEFNDLFAGFSLFGQALGSFLLYFVCLVGLAIVGQSVQLIGTFAEVPVLVGIGALINLVFSFMVVMRFYFAPFYIVDQNMGCIDAMRASWQASSQQLLNTILLAILAGIIAVAGILALVIGVFVTVTMSYLMYASAYRQIVGPASPNRY